MTTVFAPDIIFVICSIIFYRKSIIFRGPWGPGERGALGLPGERGALGFGRLGYLRAAAGRGGLRAQPWASGGALEPQGGKNRIEIKL